jgi:hypothetical protein
MTIKVPNFSDPVLSKFLVDMMKDLENTDKDSLSKVTANHSVLLQSQDKTVWEVTVSNAGAMVITKVVG